MANINLLPWREERLVYKNRIFVAMILSSALMGVLLMVGVSEFVQMFLSSQESEIDYLKNQMGYLDNQIKEIDDIQSQKDVIIKRRNIIQSLQANRQFIVKLFDSVARAVPDGLYLTLFSREGDKLVIEGMTESNAGVSLFMRNLERLDWLSEANLQEISRESKALKETESGEKNAFKLELQFKSPAEVELAKQEESLPRGP